MLWKVNTNEVFFLSILSQVPQFYINVIISCSLTLPNVYFSQVVAYNGATSGRNFRDMEAADVKFQMGIGCIRVVFLNKFVMNLLVSVRD